MTSCFSGLNKYKRQVYEYNKRIETWNAYTSEAEKLRLKMKNHMRMKEKIPIKDILRQRFLHDKLKKIAGFLNYQYKSIF